MKNLVSQRYENSSFSKKKNSSILQTANGIGSGLHYFKNEKRINKLNQRRDNRSIDWEHQNTKESARVQSKNKTIMVKDSAYRNYP